MWALHVAARSTLIAATRVLDRAHVPFLVVKGAVTAYSLYPDPSERPLGDVDIRIRPQDFRRSARAFDGAGWSVSDWKPDYGAFIADLRGVSVDVESVIGAPGLCAMSIEEMMSRATRGPSGADFQVPEVHDHAVLLCVNIFKDKFVHATPWGIEDTRRIGESRGFDADRFVARARQARIACIAWIVADWMVRETDSAAWARVKDRLGGARAPRPSYAWAFRKLQERAPSSLATRILARLAADEPKMRIEGIWAAARLKSSRALIARGMLARPNIAS
jgi:hypothetical protein